jgi:small subunit ribosomal protein S17
MQVILMDHKDIGIDVKPPESACEDINCPFHGDLPVRGQIIDGVVVSTKMDKTAVVERKYMRYQNKYERYEKRTGR